MMVAARERAPRCIKDERRHKSYLTYFRPPVSGLSVRCNFPTQVRCSQADSDVQVNPAIDWFTESVLGGWEEGTKSFIRESFTNTTRFLNGFFSWCLAFFVGKEQYRTLKGTGSRTHAWQAWWQEDRQSTLNAFIATHTPKEAGRRKPSAPFCNRRALTSCSPKFNHTVRAEFLHN